MDATNATSPVGFKTAMRAQWDHAAAGWDAHTPAIRAWLAGATEAMLDMAGVRAGSRVLDVAAGAGDQTLDIARRIGPQGWVLATDISPAIVALAAQRLAAAGCIHAETRVADAEELALEPGSFDAAVCRLGLMLMPEPLQALRGMHQALREGGGICVMVFSRPEANPCLGILMSTALRHAGLPPRDPFQPGGLLSLGRPGRLDELMREAGFRDVATTALQAPFHLPSARHYLDFVRESAGPIQQILAGLAPAAQQAAWDDMEQRLRAFDTADGWLGPNELLLTAGRR